MSLSNNSTSCLDDKAPYQILHHYWGYSDFRPNQLAIIQSVLCGDDTLAILPTGGGKSLCFQVPALTLWEAGRGITLVISPLISLMKDQVDQLQKRNVPAIFLDSNLKGREARQQLLDIAARRHPLVYLSPEKLKNQAVLKLLTATSDAPQISMIAIDEAHCLSLWGHDFRPSFLAIKDFVAQLPTRPPLIALTATTTPATTNDIITNLQLRQPKIFTQSFERENLYLRAINCTYNSSRKKLALLRIIKSHLGQAGIIYTLTRAAAVEVATWLNQINFLLSAPVAIYHGGLDRTIRSQIQDSFINNQTPIIVATNAFGMGVDKADIRFIVHYQCSANLENYYQEIGRAGRDGNRGDCYLLYDEADLKIAKQFILKLENKKRQKIMLTKLEQMRRYALLPTAGCRQVFINHYFDPQTDLSKICQRCDHCTADQIPLYPDRDELLLCQKFLARRSEISQQLNSRIEPKYLLPPVICQYLALLKPQNQTQLAQVPHLGRGFISQPKLNDALLNLTLY